LRQGNTRRREDAERQTRDEDTPFHAAGGALGKAPDLATKLLHHVEIRSGLHWPGMMPQLAQRRLTRIFGIPPGPSRKPSPSSF
jgi:hypothetical protein